MMVMPSAGSQTALVLVIDPEPANQRALRDKLLGLGYTARLADDYSSAASIIEATPPDVLLVSDQVAPTGKGWSEVQVHLNNWGIPLLKISEILPGVEAGASPALINQLPDSSLKLRIDAALSTRNLYKALALENARLIAERLHDPLTGLHNRRYMMIRTEEEIKRSSRHGYPLSCLLCDVDNFSAVNDGWGHIVGDGVLRDLAHIVTRTLRGSDITARYHDDQFMGLLTDTEVDGAQVAANRLRDAVAAHDFFNLIGSEPIKLTVSIGVAYWQPATRPGEGTWEPQLIGLAERALKAAKLSGVNRLVMLQAA